MHRLFEDFVQNFAALHLAGAKVSAMDIQWQATDLTDTAADLLPGMITDVTIAWPDRKLILDCKYYHEALVTRHDALRFRSGNLYQLHAYLTNKAIEPGWENAEAMLLYPFQRLSLRSHVHPPRPASNPRLHHRPPPAMAGDRKGATWVNQQRFWLSAKSESGS